MTPYMFAEWREDGDLYWLVYLDEIIHLAWEAMEQRRYHTDNGTPDETQS